MGIKKASETDVLKACLQYLRVVRGWVAWRNNCGAMPATYKGKSRLVRFNGAPGSSDIFFVTRQGRFGCVEVKSDSGKLTPLQSSWLGLIRDTNGIALCVRSVTELEHLFAELGYASTES